ncbi:aorsin [Hyaloscypha sp. PMI_1271]|nr:aorsin [Hyaloscypha sp. PMI_1271]
MRFNFLKFLLAFVATAQSAAVPSSHVLHEKRDPASSKQWIRREKPASTEILPMRIGLKQRNLHRGHDFLMDNSHPDSENYGKHWTSSQIIDVFAPERKSVDAVRKWLDGFGIGPRRVSRSQNKGWLAFDATKEEAESLLHTEYHYYEHRGFPLVATPEGLPGTAAGELSTCDEFITPACIRSLYNVPEIPEYAKTGPRVDNSMGIFEEGDFYSPKDLDIFFANFTPRIPRGTRPTPALIDGSDLHTDVLWAGGESNLDFQLAYPLIFPQNITLFQTDDRYYAATAGPESGLFNTFLDGIDESYCKYSAFGETGDDSKLDPKYPDPMAWGFQGKPMCGAFKPTKVISISYGGQESDLPAYYQQRQCNEFMKLGLQGHSVFFASGDTGVAGAPRPLLGKDRCLGPNNTIFSPAWPNTCPYVTNVGATKVFPNHSVRDPESAVVDLPGHPWRVAYSSGGGFSNIYARPDYQKHAVSKYLRDHKPPYPCYESISNSSFGKHGGLFNRLGRAYPDVAANGDNIVVFINGEFQISGGTSASTPIFASLINRINELRLNAGKSTVGFINPALYSHPEMLNDITNGTNPGCGTAGFSAAPGWDPVTGLGTPNFPKMVKFFMNLP